MTPDEAMSAFYAARKEYARVSYKYRAGKITLRERDLMRGLLNAAMRRFKAMARAAEAERKERMLCSC